jgi:hypothetical protein
MARRFNDYYEEGVTVKGSKTEREFFYHGKYIGRVDTVQNWGDSYLARPVVEGAKNKFFPSLRDAQVYLRETMEGTSNGTA